MGKMNSGNWGAFLSGGVQGAETEQNMEAKNLQNQYSKNALVDPAIRQNNYEAQQYNKYMPQLGYSQTDGAAGVFDPVKNKLGDVWQNIKSRFLPNQGQHAMGPSSQPTVPQATNVAMSPPGPSSSNSASPGVPGATGPMPMPQQDMRPSGPPYANGGAIPGKYGRSGALRNKKAKPQNAAKPTAAAADAMHMTMEKAPVDAQEMGAEGGPPRNTDAQPGSQDPMLANGGAIRGRKRFDNGGMINAARQDAQSGKASPAGIEQDQQISDRLSSPNHRLPVTKTSPTTPPKPLPIAPEGSYANGGAIRGRRRKFDDGGKVAPASDPVSNQINHDKENYDGEDVWGHWPYDEDQSTVDAAKRKDQEDADRVASPNHRVNLNKAKRPPYVNPNPTFANGGAVDKPMPFKIPKAPKPQPNMVQREIGEDGQRNRLGRTIKKFADGSPGAVNPIDPTAQAAKNAPETNAEHLTKFGKEAWGALTSSPLNYIPGLENPYQIDPWQSAVDMGKNVVGAIKNWGSQPWDTPDQGAAPGAEPKAAPPQQQPQGQQPPQGPPRPDGAPQGPQQPGATPPVPGRQGPPRPAAPAPAAGPVDFSQLRIGHQDIPSTTAAEWEESKKSMIAGMVAKGVPFGQAQLQADNQISDYQHKNFMQYVQQGIALDAAGDKEGAMAALKTGYQYMPTGHDIHFALDPKTNSIVGFGVNEQTGKPVGQPLQLNQQALNKILATYQDPKNFLQESLALRNQAMQESEAPARVRLLNAQSNNQNSMAEYYGNRDQTTIGAAMIRSAGRGAIPQDQWAKVNAALSSKIADPNLQSQATGVATYLIQNGHAPGDAVAIAGMMYTAPAEQRAMYAQKYHIPIPELQMAPDATNPYAQGGNPYMQGGYGVPPR